MRWRFVDKVTALQPWQEISGLKAVGLEEYCLLEPLGREYVLPESLVIEACVELARWLVTASSSFSLTGLLSEIEGFRFARPAQGGEVLELHARVLNRGEPAVSFACLVTAQGRAVAAGELTLETAPLRDGPDRDEMMGRWRELHGSA